MTRRPTRPKEIDLEFAATVQAQELRFADAPETGVSFTGNPAYHSASGSDRTNLPDRVQPGMLYRDVKLDYRLAAKLIDPLSHGPDDEGELTSGDR